VSTGVLWQQSLQLAATLLVMLPGVYLQAWLDAKLGADLQARVGPSRAGSAGWLQPMADFLRLWQKVRPGSKGEHGSALWWAQGAPLFALLTITPVGAGLPLLTAPMSVLMSLMMAISFAWIGMILSWRSGLVEARLASIRQMALGAAGIFPALLAILQVGFSAQGLSWQNVDQIQGWAPWSWFAFSSPFAFVSALVFVAAGLLLFSSPPFHLGSEAVRWIVAGFPGEAGIRLIWVRFSQRIAHFCWTLLTVRLFFGGAALPSLFTSTADAGSAPVIALSVAVTLLKALTILAVTSILSRTLPSVRADQAHEFSWRVLSPLALLALVLGRLISVGGAP
jgi:NADH-quinone oxidoreductase subunit H